MNKLIVLLSIIALTLFSAVSASLDSEKSDSPNKRTAAYQKYLSKHPKKIAFFNKYFDIADPFNEKGHENFLYLLSLTDDKLTRETLAELWDFAVENPIPDDLSLMLELFEPLKYQIDNWGWGDVDEPEKIRELANILYPLKIFKAFPDDDNLITKGVILERYSEGIKTLIDVYEGNIPSVTSARIIALTPKEARDIFSDYVTQNLKSKKNIQRDLNIIFSDKYFGQPKSENVSDEEIINLNMKYFIKSMDFILDGLRFPEYRDFNFQRFRKSLSEVDPRFLLIDGKKVYEEYLKHNPQYQKKAIKFLMGENDKSSARTEREAKEVFKKINDEIFLSYAFFGIPDNKKERERFFLKKRVLGLLSQWLIKNIYHGAKKILSMSHKGDYIVIFGNTPYFVGRALNRLASTNPKKQSYRHVVPFPFSGSPNRNRWEDGELPTPENLVTPSRLRHLKERLKNVGLSCDNEKLLKVNTYFVDAIGSGKGPLYVIEAIIRNCKKTKGEIPHIAMISLNEVLLYDKEKRINLITKKKGLNKITTFFLPNKSNPHLSIPNYEAYVHGHGLLDNIENSMRMLPEYNAYLWNKKYDYLLTQEPQQHKKVILEYFDANIDRLMKLDKSSTAN